MKINIEITGKTPLLMHRFELEQLEKTKSDKNLTPREEASKFLYEEDGKLCLPMENIFACLVQAGRFHKIGKKQITTNTNTILPAAISIEVGNIFFTRPTTEWEVHTRGVVNPSTQGRVVSHRPRLDDWCIEFCVDLDVNEMSSKQLREIVDSAGKKIGLGSNRPAKKGMYGQFVVTKWTELKDVKDISHMKEDK